MERRLRGHIGLWDSIREWCRVWEGRGWSGKLVKGALSTGLVSEVLIVSRLRGHE